jgi:hypothetical protein
MYEFLVVVVVVVWGGHRLFRLLRAEAARLVLKLLGRGGLPGHRHWAAG